MRIFRSKALNLIFCAINALMAWYWWGLQDGTTLPKALLVAAVFAGTSQLYFALEAWEAEIREELLELESDNCAE